MIASPAAPLRATARPRARRGMALSVRAMASPAKRGVVILPGLGNASPDYDKLITDLEARGYVAGAAQVRRVDWLRNALGLRYPDYWKGTLKPRPTVDWYLERISAAVDEVQAEVGGDKVALVAHSAGGWLARVWMDEFGTDKVDMMLSLGSPHLAAPKGVPGTIDQTRGLLDYCTDRFPGAYHDDVSYVTVAGNYIRGAELNAEGASINSRVVGAGYKQVCGAADVWGDGITPVPSAHLEGAKQLTLEGVYHSPVGASDEAGGARPWYGSDGVLDQWAGELGGSA